MTKLLVFGASSSSNSINKKLALFTAAKLPQFQSNIIDLNDFEMPIFNVDREKNTGIPEPAREFKKLIHQADGIIISLAEHNGSYSAAFKNIFDWASRVEKSMWLDKPMFLLATSPGARGGGKVLAAAVDRFPFMGGRVVASFSLPSFNQNFKESNGITDAGLESQFQEQLALFVEALQN